jgi:ADP-ribose pyrophosphatase YjhB (NUDIX family)
MSGDKISKEIESKFGHHLRSRVNGVLIENEKILMVKHLMGNGREFWSTPGGGMIYGTTAKDNLKREFLEETGLAIEVGDYLFVHEFLDPPLHAMEHFFTVNCNEGIAVLGKDPELSQDNQILAEIRWMSLKELHSLEKNSLHRVFWGIKSLSELVLCKGYFNFGNYSIK